MTYDPPTTTSRLSAGEVSRRTFGTTRRGFDPHQVRAYLELVGKELQAAERREQELLHELAAAEERARHPVIDENLLTSALGERSAALLRSAHDEAARIARQAEETAAALVREAQEHAADSAIRAESSAAERIAEAELAANAVRQQAADEAAALVEAARIEGEGVIERAREHGRAMLDQAQEARRRVLADMAHRRRLVTEQIEQFRAARDEVAASILNVRHSLDRIVEDLSRADEAARAAAEAARHHAADVPEAVLVEEAERAAAALGVQSGSTPPDDVLAERAAPRPQLRADDVATVVERATGAVATEEVATQVVAEGVTQEGATGEAAEAPARSDGAAADVEGLFARLRARHSDEARTGPATAAAGGGTGAAEVTGPGATTRSEEPEAHSPTGEGATAASAESGTRTGGDGAGEGDATELSPDGAALARRAAALDPIVTTMARRLKRALQDDQNRLLDRLRKGTGEWTDDLLLDEPSQRALYLRAASESIRESVAAGIAFGRALSGGRSGRVPSPDQRTVDAVTDDLVGSVVTLLRRRLEGADVPDAAERIGAAFREWRGERIERLAEDRAIDAFGAGVLAGAARGARFRWVRSETGPGCADCEDNALAGAVARGEAFPTGHRHPPAHAGCRCLVVPTPA